MSDQVFIPGNGRIATDLNDFLHHIHGTDFKHSANQITNSPGVAGGTTVQESIDNINTFIASLVDQGKAFVAIPDGYNSYTNPSPNVYFNKNIPALNTFLTPLFAAIVAGTTMPAGYSRLAKGGILYIPGGVYYFTDTVVVPPGIILLGEGFATKLINATALNLTVNPPIVNGLATPKPIFNIKDDTNRASDDSVIDSDDPNGPYMFGRAIKFMNLTIGDNFIEPTALGDLNYGLPQNTAGNTPLILQNQGSNLELHNVYMIGRATTTGTSVDEATRYAVRLDTITPSTGSMLKIENCFFDGFSLPISFDSSAGIEDYLCVSGSKIRSHGFLGGDGSTEENNCVIHMNDNNAKITNNNFYGNHSACKTICYIKNTLSVAPVANSRSAILIASNHFVIDKGSGATITANNYFVDSTIDLSTIRDFVFIIAYGNANNIESGFRIEQDQGNSYLEISDSAIIRSSNQVIIGSDSGTIAIGDSSSTVSVSTEAAQLFFTGGLNSNSAVLVSSTPYVMDGVVPNYILLVKTTTIGATCQITLPVYSDGRRVIVKDIEGTTSTNNIQVSSQAAETIEGVASPATFFADRGCWEFIAANGGWHLLS